MAHDDPEQVWTRWLEETRATLGDEDPELVEEVAEHLTDRWQRVRAEGLSASAADAIVRSDLARWKRTPLPYRKEPAPRARFWTGLGSDIRYALRTFRRRPIFAAGSIVLAAVATAAVAAAAAIVYGVLFRPLAYPEADRLAVLWQVRGGVESQISFPDYVDLAATGVFDAASAIAGGRGSLRVADGIERVNLLELEPSGFAMLGATPALGRLLGPADVGQPNILISHRLWTTQFGSDAAVLGRSLWLSGRDYTVVGVLRAGLDFELPVPPAFTLERNEIWTLFETSNPMTQRRDVTSYEALVRLAPGRTLADAQAAADALAARLAETHRATNEGRTFRVAPLKDEVVGHARRPLLFVALAAVVTWLVALANLVVLTVARGSERGVELSIREALGAGSFRLRRQLLAEHALIALCGAAGGALLARQALVALLSADGARLPRADAILFDAPVWIAVALVALVVVAALTAQPLRLKSALLRSGTRTTGSMRRTRWLLVGGEVALALVLATGGSFLGLSLVRLLSVDLGFVPEGAAAARVSAYAARYPNKADVVRFFDEVQARLVSTSDLSAAGGGLSLPLSGQMTGTSVVAEGIVYTAASRPNAGWQFITPKYFEAAGMRIIAGRDFAPEDRDRARHVTIINEDLARALFPDGKAVGRRIGVGGGEREDDWHDVIGVVGDVRHRALDAPAEPRIYDLFGQHWGRSMFVVARSRTSDAAGSLRTIRRTVRDIDPEAPVFEAATLPELVDRSAAARRLASVVSALLAATAVLLALLGVYAVAAGSALERTNEMGVRAALGATPAELFRLIARDGARAAIWGALAGVCASVVVIRYLQSQLFGVQPSDAVWLLPAVALAVMIAAIVAAFPAAARAARVDPLTAIRE